MIRVRRLRGLAHDHGQLVATGGQGGGDQGYFRLHLGDLKSLLNHLQGIADALPVAKFDQFQLLLGKFDLLVQNPKQLFLFLDVEPEVHHGSGKQQGGLFRVISACVCEQLGGFGSIGDLLPEIQFPGQADADGESIPVEGVAIAAGLP